MHFKKIVSVVTPIFITLLVSGWIAYNYILSPTTTTCALQYSSKKPFTHTNFPKHIPFKQKNGFINDASCVNQTPIYGIIDIRTVENIHDAFEFARENNLKITVAGVKHSMGGQAFYENALIKEQS